MGFMDKVKAQAEVAVAKAQQGVAQGQSKIDDYQAKKSADGLLLALGQAFHAEQRAGGSHDDVVSALAAVDAHVAEHGPISAPDAPAPAYDTGMPAAPGAPAAPGPASAASQPTPPAGGGSFSLDDI